MGIYESFVLPQLLDLACGTKPVRKQREKVVPRANGRVLEIGMGSGLNLPHYDRNRVDCVWALEPSEGMRRKAKPRLADAPFEIKWLDLPGEEIPLEDASIDTVLVTYTLCTIPDYRSALAQMRRVLRPSGSLLFSEHGAAPDVRVRRWQQRVNPLWRSCFGGCNIDRDIPKVLAEAGFKIEEIDSMYLPGTPKIAGFNYWGRAVHG